MKFESMILGALFVACFSICVLAMAAMLTATATPAQVVGTTAPAATVAAAQGGGTQPIAAARCTGATG